MKKLVFVLVFAPSAILTGCSWIDSPFSEDAQQEENVRKEEPYWRKSEYHKAIVTGKTNGVCAWHRVWFRIEGREKDSFENNVDCWNDLRMGDSIMVEEVFSSVIHYYAIQKINP